MLNQAFAVPWTSKSTETIIETQRRLLDPWSEPGQAPLLPLEPVLERDPWSETQLDPQRPDAQLPVPTSANPGATSAASQCGSSSVPTALVELELRADGFDTMHMLVDGATTLFQALQQAAIDSDQAWYCGGRPLGLDVPLASLAQDGKVKIGGCLRLRGGCPDREDAADEPLRELSEASSSDKDGVTDWPQPTSRPSMASTNLCTPSSSKSLAKCLAWERQQGRWATLAEEQWELS